MARLYRFKIQSYLGENLVQISPQDSHHAINVLRLRKTDKLIVFDEKIGREFVGEIISLNPTVVKILQEQRSNIFIDNDLLKCLHLSVIFPIPKGKRMDFLLEKATEIGVDDFYPVETFYSTIKVKNMNVSKQSHWIRKIYEAVKQSQRLKLPSINKIDLLENVIKQTKDYQIKLLANLSRTAKPLPLIFPSLYHKQCPVDFEAMGKINICLLVGPEAGFSREEVELAKNNGFIEVLLANHVLRIETAVIVGASCIINQIISLGANEGKKIQIHP